jgi:1-aminocyclopropane-1-carboxylate deaminase/D-cysteine desulfhydrase-like pyridoxal-dependent ACC family enzyme
LKHPFAEELRKDRREAKLAADAFVCACQTGDTVALLALAEQPLP